MRPKKKPDPLSKRSQKRQQEMQRRIDNVDPELKETLHEMLEGGHEEEDEVPYFIPLDLWQDT
eukprot:2757150-Pyramimonas_sp.AAC.1